MQIAVLYIGTGRYMVFWDGFYKSCVKHFIPEAKKQFFFFTDNKLSNVPDDVTVISIPQVGWPSSTMRRFEYFNSIGNLLKNYDFVFFFNGNVQFLRKIDSRDFLPNQEQGIVACTRMADGSELCADRFPFERNPASQAYVPYGTLKKYHQGGILGGFTPRFLELSEECERMTRLDLAQGIIPVWHDESIFNKYLLTHPFKELSPYFLFAPRIGRFWWRINPRIKILLRDKNHYRFGGHDWLRGITDKKQTFWSYWRHALRGV